ncbi:UDP-N-acetylmuramate: L-alanyl-gamma-D-glutamyl-meso-diaminopimelate ligase [Pseudidiomarina planktonica]|uniref:UDP-N-acetylmuramate--L-alanyl-gamma-D-glutamyl-meso-2,6-diaminoheptandioate ligase n=1 Tax=Pseudidiomarina planktonica TaxID=1323738 RepID=A0A1Y6FYZ9_9GAMM|nr:UDP-N-acetylmuramate:L-alanyl-gamma-D-glutamyl-meso-diaminopimelate ligase [Pseudidiomarina planktonica]RUO63462.1 UDP-N-acetylmuramate:L-alanyl-gamma-D-glutamyl-meso-diaminopimelate ligase [Pseudidiomarina planktonica]SMQ80287.1 UDP-N-acetylmuramate: L-alanyl-gamma-D-glutamyl-meso-diaminopimelate ligase [Pseudidiomarina planktonica]
MHIHILGICGTFMAGIATLAKELGHEVTGADQQVYPPMSTLLQQQGIELTEGYAAEDLPEQADLILIGNALSRGNPAVEAVLNRRLPYQSAAQWLHDEVLQTRWVLAVAGTHGKTTTASILSWLLEAGGLQPGFLVGGVLANFDASARLGNSDFFVIEADEYDTAFFDKRSKFVHYCPSTLILNNLEFDHADIFPDLAAIQRQFAHLLRVVPGYGQVLYPLEESNLDAVFAAGCWSERVSVGPKGRWQAKLQHPDGSKFDVYFDDKLRGQVSWDLVGQHNVANALMAIAAAMHVGVSPEVSCAALADYRNTKRRLELRGEVNHIRVYDDFAHHPTAIATTLAGLRAKVGSQRIIAVLELRSNTMKVGVHADQLAASLAAADEVFILVPPQLPWSVADQVPQAHCLSSVDHILLQLKDSLRANDQVLIMSNGGFENIHERLLEQLRS